ncbi:Udp-glycosyltransferase 83a1 [Thalictrum thalictroides]|uniref:Udp-glycosyltransferase 83a1 n=1 Tax=Thalictrum thalictroides TaxID=46969 RepID=A0A7J6VF72_THATH|nr:Udp-glycosyltransferase 83a1 [Thalictrum thalictroides]
MTIMARPHLLVIPYPAQGHVMPLMELSHNLVDRGFKITFVNTEFNHKRVIAALSNNNADYEEFIHLASIPDGMEPEEDRNQLGKLSDLIVNVMPGHLEELIKNINESDNGDSKITCVLADSNMGWALEVAEKLSIRRAAFWPASGVLLAVLLHIPKLIEDGIIDTDGSLKKTDMIQLSPEMPAMNPAHFVWLMMGDKAIQKSIYNLLVKGGGETKSVVVDESEEARGDSTMPSRFRYLTKEAPDRPVRWPWLIAVAFGIYAWRTVLWELSNWKKGLLAIGKFMGYLLKLALAVVLHFIGTPITGLIRCIETALYTVRSVYSGIVAAAPIQELTVIILLTSTLLAIAEAAVPDSVNSQPYLLTLSGIVGLAAVTDFIPELVFWLLLMGIFCFSCFFKKRDLVTSLLPMAAALSAVGQPWLRLVVITSYVALAISHHSKKLSDSNVEAASAVRKLPAPLLVAALTIGIHVAAKWIRYRHLTWMIV